ncbi:Fe2+ or Zn2+ uptake regulation protein [Gulbenkiania indica]|uniref:Ferric uptake regulation protein n=1 Tax=Gulbenkiania indica TaxID=375574 RepID=A0A0K6GWP9_9NEIS|nr:Fur family transcriptional regulator [Gulbenkiania indica]CUA83152.1 Fe2+ or Zn2+ uptake regulation protein [Gulbenkiania indica]
MARFPTVSQLEGVLKEAGIPATLQRLAVARVLLTAPVHLSADEVLTRVRAFAPDISRATVYNTLNLFSRCGLIREVVVESGRTLYDSSTHPHAHFYDVDTGTLSDAPDSLFGMVGRPHLPPGLQLEQVDVILRVRSAKASPPEG